MSRSESDDDFDGPDSSDREEDNEYLQEHGGSAEREIEGDFECV